MVDSVVCTREGTLAVCSRPTSWLAYHLVHASRNSTVIDMESNSLSINVEFFFDCGFFSLCTFCTQNSATVSLCDSKLYFSRSCPILVLKKVMGRPRRADVEKDVKNDQGPKKGLLSRF